MLTRIFRKKPVNDAKTIQGKTVGQYILNQEASGQEENEGIDVIQSGLFANVFRALQEELTTLFKLAMFPTLTLFSIAKEINSWLDFKEKNNKNLKTGFDRALGTITTVAEITAVTIALGGIAFAALASIGFIVPILFTALVGSKFLYATFGTVFHGIKWAYHAAKGEGYTAEAQEQKAKFLGNLKGFVVGGVLAAGIVSAFLLPALSITFAAAAAIKWATMGVLAANATFGIGKALVAPVKKFFGWMGEKLGLGAAPEQAPLLSRAQAPLTEKKQKKENQLSDNYLDHTKFSEITNNHGDLIRKLDYIRQYRGPESAKEFVETLIAEEEKRITNGQNNPHKLEALKYLTDLISRRGQATVKDDHGTDIIVHNMAGLLAELDKNGTKNSIFKSIFRDVGGMQNLFLVVDRYLEMFPAQDVQAAEATVATQTENRRGNPYIGLRSAGRFALITSETPAPSSSSLADAFADEPGQERGVKRRRTI